MFLHIFAITLCFNVPKDDGIFVSSGEETIPEDSTKSSSFDVSLCSQLYLLFLSLRQYCQARVFYV